MSCPSEEDLAAFFQRHRRAHMDPLFAHLRECPRCAQWVELARACEELLRIIQGEDPHGRKLESP